MEGLAARRHWMVRPRCLAMEASVMSLARLPSALPLGASMRMVMGAELFLAPADDEASGPAEAEATTLMVVESSTMSVAFLNCVLVARNSGTETPICAAISA